MSTTLSFLPLYDQYFPKEVERGAVAPNWNGFKSSEADLMAPVSGRPADFSIHRTWAEVAKSVAHLSLQTALFCWVAHAVAGVALHRLIKIAPRLLSERALQFLRRDILAEALSKCQANHPLVVLTLKVVAVGALARYILQRIVMLPLYPAQSRIVKFFFPDIAGTHALDLYRKEATDALNQEGYIVRHVALEKKGVRYSGLLIGHSSTINNGKWALQATGNLEPVEHSANDFALIYREMQFNTLVINGPAVGRSKGQATPESMGDAQEVGISFLETALKAKKIVIAGRSLGGAAVGQALLKHTFKEGVNYLVIRQMTFDRASNICAKTVGNIFSILEWPVAKLVQGVGCEMDSVAASRKLQQLGIKEVIVQSSTREMGPDEVPTVNDFHTDGPIHAKASLGHTLVQEKVILNKVFRCLHRAGHMTHDAITAAKPEIQAL